MSFMKFQHLLTSSIRLSQTFRPGFLCSLRVRPLHSRTVQIHKVWPSEFVSPEGATVLPSKLQGFQCRRYGHGVEMTKHLLTERIMLILRLYDKINPDKLTVESQFAKDLGLDSLDHVELIMAVEDEFGFEIPDKDAERLRCPADIVQYLCDKLDVFD